MKAILVTFKNGHVDAFQYKNVEALKEDMETLTQVFRDRSCDGYIGSMEEGFFINAREIASVHIADYPKKVKREQKLKLELMPSDD